MLPRSDHERLERLCLLAAARQERKARGSERNLLLHLALLRHAVSIGKLGIMKSGQARGTGFRSAMSLNRRAARLGEIWVVRNNALNRFNCGDMPGYRWWLHQAARAGDEESGEDLIPTAFDADSAGIPKLAET